MIAPCDRCGREGADWTFPRFCICKWCDDPVTPILPEVDWVEELFADIELELDDWSEPATAPGWGSSIPAGCVHVGSYVSRDQHGTLNRWCTDCGRFLGKVP